MQKYFWWTLVTLWCGIIFGLSNIPDLNSGLKYDFILRKIGHSVEFLILFFLVVKAMFTSGYNLPNKVYFFSLTFSFLYAALDEFHQKFIPGRSGVFIDVIIDCSGAAIFILLKYLLIKKNYVEHLSWKKSNKI